MVERVRWQLDAWINLPRGSEQEITGGIVLVRLTPDEVRADIGSQLGLWGGQSEADRQAAYSGRAGQHDCERVRLHRFGFSIPKNLPRT